MLNLLKKRINVGRSAANVGWLINAEAAGFIWEAPRKLSRDEQTRSPHAKSVSVCPAVNDADSRLLEMPCPIDLHLRLVPGEKGGEPRFVNVAGERSTIRPKALGQIFSAVGQKEWRHPDRPIIQIVTPYHFLADEAVYMTQTPPFAHFRVPQLPGLVIGGRYPIHIWPRPLMWAFEWHDPAQDLVLRRGEPWFYVRFETHDPSRPVRIVEADYTPELRTYLQGLSSVANYVNRTFSLFSIARERRPKTLLHPKK